MSKERILIADDDPDIRIFLRTSLEEQGFSVVEAENGRETHPWLPAASQP